MTTPHITAFSRKTRETLNSQILIVFDSSFSMCCFIILANYSVSELTAACGCISVVVFMLVQFRFCCRACLCSETVARLPRRGFECRRSFASTESHGIPPEFAAICCLVEYPAVSWCHCYSGFRSSDWFIACE